MTLTELINNTVRTGCSGADLTLLQNRMFSVGYLAIPALVSAIENPATRALATELLAALIRDLISQNSKGDLAVAADYGNPLVKALEDTEWKRSSRGLMIEIIATILPLKEIIAIIRTTGITLGNCAADVFISSVQKNGDISTLVEATGDECHAVQLPAIEALSLLERGTFDQIVMETLGRLHSTSGMDTAAQIHVAHGMLRYKLEPEKALQILAEGTKTHLKLVLSFFP